MLFTMIMFCSMISPALCWTTAKESVSPLPWWYITMERSCQAQLLAEAAGTPRLIPHDVALQTRETVGSALAGWFSFQPLNDVILAEQPELLE